MGGRSQCLAATALAPYSSLSRLPRLLLAAPLALAPAGAGATTIAIGSGCTLTGATVCDATTKIPSPNAGDTIAFSGGVLTMNGKGITYPELATLTSGDNQINQDGNSNTFSGVISNATGNTGKVTITNNDPTNGNTLTAGSVIFSAINTYTGATTINTGATLALSGSGSIATSSGVADAGTFDISGASGGVTIKNLTGAGAVTLGGNTVFLANNAASSFSGNISGTGGVTVSSNKETLTGTLGYTGATTVDTGATLVLGANGASTSLASLAGGGTVTLHNNQALTISNTLKTVSTGNTFSGTIGSGNGNTTVTLASGTQSLMGSVTVAGTTTVSSGATLTGTGSVSGNVANNGTLKPFNTVSNSTGKFTIGGKLTESSTSVLDFVFSTGGVFSTVSVTNAATLAGTLSIETINGFLFPKATTQYNSLLGSVGATSGDFTNMTYNGTPCTGGNDVWVCHNVTFHNLIGAAGVSITARRVPEPTTLALLGTGLVGLLALRRRGARSSMSPGSGFQG